MGVDLSYPVILGHHGMHQIARAPYGRKGGGRRHSLHAPLEPDYRGVDLVVVPLHQRHPGPVVARVPALCLVEALGDHRRSVVHDVAVHHLLAALG